MVGDIVTIRWELLPHRLGFVGENAPTAASPPLPPPLLIHHVNLTSPSKAAKTANYFPKYANTFLTIYNSLYVCALNFSDFKEKARNLTVEQGHKDCLFPMYF